MCLIALLYRVVGDAPVVLGANREEAYARGGEPPAVRSGPCPFVAGIDPVQGGTWLGVNAAGVLIAVTNRLKTNLPAEPRSRGLLTRDLLSCSSASAAATWAGRALGQNHYAGCNFLCADANNAIIIQGGEWLRVRPLPPGLHVLANRDVNDATDRRVQHALHWLAQRSYSTSHEALTALKALCSQTDQAGCPIVLRGEQRGTVSSTLIALRHSLARSTYLHAQGPPDVTPYENYSALLQRLTHSA